jgi:DNA-binding FadR family transcriptional regulator
MFEPLGYAPAYLRLSEAIRARILSRELKDGEALPTEGELARQFGVNRSTVREALRNLQSAGLLARRAGGKRLFVTRPTLEAFGDGASHAIALHGARFADLWEALLTVEPAIAAAAAQRRSSADLAALGATAEAFLSARDAAHAVERVAEFFRQLGQATGNPVYALVNEPLMRLLEPGLATIIDRVPQARRRIATAQQRLVDAVREGSREEAATWMAKHIRDFRRGYEVAGIPLDAFVTVAA